MSASIERDVIVTLLSDKNILSEISTKLKVGHLTVPYIRWVYARLLKFWGKYSDIPTLTYFKTRIEKDPNLNVDDKARYLKLVRQLFKTDVTTGAKRYAIDEIQRFIAKQEITKKISKSLDKLEVDDVEAALDELMASGDIKLYENEYEIWDYVDQWDTRQTARREKKKDPEVSGVVKFPWPTLNNMIDGLAPTEVGTIAGTTGVGKSICLMLCGRNAFLSGHKVLHIVIEDSYELLANRYDSSILGVPYNALMHLNLTAAERKMIRRKFRLVKSHMGKNLIIAKTYPRRTSVITVKQILNEVKEKYNFIPTFLIIDYADVMIPAEKQEAYRLDQSYVYWDLKGLAHYEKLPILTATQVAKEWRGKRATSESLAEAYDKARILNLILTLNRPDRNKQELILHVAKNRGGIDGMDVPLIARYEIMRVPEDRSKEE